MAPPATMVDTASVAVSRSEKASRSVAEAVAESEAVSYWFSTPGPVLGHVCLSTSCCHAYYGRPLVSDVRVCLRLGRLY